MQNSWVLLPTFVVLTLYPLSGQRGWYMEGVWWTWFGAKCWLGQWHLYVYKTKGNGCCWKIIGDKDRSSWVYHSIFNSEILRFNEFCRTSGWMFSNNFILRFFSCYFRIKELKCPDSLAEHYKPVACRIRQWLSEHALIVFPVSTLVFHFWKTTFQFTCSIMIMLKHVDNIKILQLIVCTVLFWKVCQRQYISSRVEELYHQVYKALRYFLVQPTEY